MNESNPDQGNSENSQYVYCPHCGGGNLLDATRCRWCRKSLHINEGPEPEVQPEAQPVSQVPLDQVYCPNCKGGNPRGAVHCMWCKRPLNLDAAAAELPPSRNLFESYKRAVIAPTLLRYAAEVPHASWRRIWLSLGIAAIVGSLVGMARGGLYEPLPLFLVFWSLLIGTVIGFFLNALYLYGLSKLFGGRGRTGKFGPDFLVHTYLLVIVFVPFSIAYDVLSFIPAVGSGLVLLLSIYGLYLNYKVIQVSRLLDPSSATATLVASVVVLVFLVLNIIAIALVLYIVSQVSLFS